MVEYNSVNKMVYKLCVIEHMHVNLGHFVFCISSLTGKEVNIECLELMSCIESLWMDALVIEFLNRLMAMFTLTHSIWCMCESLVIKMPLTECRCLCHLHFNILPS